MMRSLIQQHYIHERVCTGQGASKAAAFFISVPLSSSTLGKDDQRLGRVYRFHCQQQSLLSRQARNPTWDRIFSK